MNYHSLTYGYVWIASQAEATEPYRVVAEGQKGGSSNDRHLQHTTILELLHSLYLFGADLSGTLFAHENWL